MTAASTPDRPQLVGRQVGGERDDERDHDLDRRVVEPAQDLAGEPADDDADHDAADRGDDEAADGIGRTNVPLTTAATAAR